MAFNLSQTPKLNIGGLSNNGAIPKASGVLSGYSIPNTSKPQNSGLVSSSGQNVQSSIFQGNNPGLISNTANSNTHTTTTNPTTGATTTKPTPNPNVLAQQKEMNKYGAGLVEDGIAGPKTQAAIASGKYTGSSTSTTPTTPPPAPLTISGQAPGVLATGNQTQNEIDTQKRLMELSKEGSPEYKQAQEAYQKAIQDYNQSVQNEVGAMAGEASRAIPLGFVQGRQQVLQSQYAGQQAGLGGLVSGASNALGAANTQQGLQTTAGQSAYTGAQTQAGRAAGTAGTVLGAVSPVQVSPTNVPYNPGTGQYGSPASTAYGASGLAGVGGLLEQQNQGAQTQNMIGAYNQAKPLIETAKQQIAAANFHPSPLALASVLQDYINKNVVPSGEYANIFNTLSEIATTISPVLGAQGAQTDLKTNIAQNFLPLLLQGKDFTTVLDNIENNALAKITANKKTATGSALTVPTSNLTGGSIWSF